MQTARIILLPFLFLIVSCKGEEKVFSDGCFGSPMLLDNGGRIVSHTQFGRRLYRNGMSCNWVIRAPFNKVVMVQPVSFNLEYDYGCNLDYLEAFDGPSAYNTSLGRFCGGDYNFRIYSTGAVMSLRFVSDLSLNKAGFELRYTFLSKSNPNNDVRDDRADRVRCRPWEALCRDRKRCIPKKFICDGIRDCRDHSDEAKCPPTPGVCHQSQVYCKSGECVPKNFWCDGIIDCRDSSDEVSCDPTTGDNTATPTGNQTCSYQPIKNSEKGNIVGGKPAIPGSWPWMVSLRYGEMHFCGGSLVDLTWVVTAAHCVEGRTSPTSWKIHLGRNTEGQDDKTLQEVSIDRIYKHSRYSEATTDHDVALIKLAKPVQLTTHVQTVCLPGASDQEPADTTECFVTGWGDTQGTGGEGVLKQAIVPIIGRNRCQQMYGGGITPNMICAGFEQGRTDSCQGDSGGPLVCRNSADKFILKGIVSWGEGCALPKRPGVYTNVVAERQWIKNTMSQA